MAMLAATLAGGRAEAAGSLRITLKPDQAVSAGAQWRRVGQTTWRDSDTTETGVAAGVQTLEFKAVPSWAPPIYKMVTVFEGKVTTETITYTYLQPGSVRVGITPPAAVAAGAKWRITGETAWRDAGTSQTGIIVGTTVNIEFKPLGGTWLTPSNRSYLVSAAQNIETTGTYVQTGGLKVTLAPPDAVAAGAQWRRAGTTTWLDSGTSETAVPVGTTRIELKPVTGYSTPVWPSATIATGQLTTATATYGAVQSGFSWGTYLGGAENDMARGIAVDEGGNVFVTGMTHSAGWGAGETTSTFHGTSLYPDVFVTKLTPTGERAWSLYLGGSSYDEGRGIALDAQGGIYVAGLTSSAGWLTGGYDTTLNASGEYGLDGFVTRLTANGTPVWGAYLGGAETEGANAVAVSGDGAVYVTGSTSSEGWIAGGFDTTYNDMGDAYVIKLTPAGARAWSTYIGGTQDDDGNGIAVDGQGRAFVAGATDSTAGIATAGLGATPKGGRDAFITALSGDGQRLWGAYVGGDATDEAYGIALDGLGGIYLGGVTNSAGWTSGGFDTTFNGLIDAFIAKATTDGQTLSWSGYFGGAGTDRGLAVAACGAEGAALTGDISEAGLCTGGYNTAFGGASDGFALKVSAAGQHVWSTYLGGAGQDIGAAVAADRRGSVFVAGYTSASAAWLSGGFDATPNGNTDGFVARLHGFGGLKLTLTPPAAAQAGAQWRPVGTTTWLASGVELTSAPSGANLIEFKTINGWSEPPRQLAMVNAGTTTETTAAYVGFGGLCATIEPAGAVSGGAQWRRAGTTAWMNSGVTENNVPARPQVVEFKAINGWNQPASQTIAITEGQTTQTTGVYTPASGALKVTLTPAGAVSAGAQWRRAGTTTWMNSDTTETNVPTGTYALEFAAAAGYTAPTLSVTVNKDQTTIAAAAYVRQTGTLKVTITPTAVASLARWRRMGTTAWMAGGSVEQNVPTGSYQVEFLDVSGWSKPATQPVTVTAGAQTTTSAQYQQMVGSLQVMITPAAAISAGAKWRLVGWATWKDSGYTTTVSSQVNQQIEFKPMNHWVEPAVRTVQATQGQTTTISGAYVAVGYLTVQMGPSKAVASGAKWRRVGDTAWLDNGTSISIATGSQTIEFKDFDASIWIKPANAAISVTHGAGQFLNKSYQYRKGSLQVSILPAAAATAGARWRIDDVNQDWYYPTASGKPYVLSGLNAGPHTVRGIDLPGSGWSAPTPSTAVIREGQTTSITITYTPTVSSVEGWDLFGDIRNDAVNAVTIDKDNNVLVVGETTTSTFSWISSKEWVTKYNGGQADAFVMKFSPTGTRLWSAYIGGAAADRGTAIATDASGNVIVAGDTGSFPWVSGGGDTMLGGSEGFVAKLSPTGKFLWSSYVGEEGDELVNGVATDGAGNIFVAGKTTSSKWAAGGWDNLAATPILSDGFVAKLTPAGALAWKTAVGDSGEDEVAGVAVDGSGAVYVAGRTDGDAIHTPQSEKPYVERLSASGQKVWKTYLNAGNTARVNAIAADATGATYVTGPTATDLSAMADAFVIKLNAAGATQWKTLLGGSNQENGTGIALDGVGNIYAVGSTGSSEWIGGGFETAFHTVKSTEKLPDNSTLTSYVPIPNEGYVAKLSPTGTPLWSSIMNGLKYNADSLKVAADSKGDIAVGGEHIEWAYSQGFMERIHASGMLKVTITPQKAIDKGAQWRILGTTQWKTGSIYSTTTPTAPGTYTVEFKWVQGWRTPAQVKVNIGFYDAARATQSTAVAAGAYVPVPNAVSGGMWRMY